MAVMMELEESVSDSKLHKESTAKKDLRPSSAISFSKSDHGPETTSSTEQLRQYKSWVSNERWNELKKIAETAMKQRKVFMIKGGGFPAIRRAMLERGWVEKYESHKVRHPPTNVDPKKASGKELSKVERMILYKFMEHHSVDFLWTTKRDKYDWLLSNKDVMISRFCRSVFTTKEGLTASLTQMHWHTEPGIALTKFPRCYNIHNSDSLEEFVDDFRITACISVLKWLCSTLQINGEQNLISNQGKVPFSAIEFATSRLNEYVLFFTHKDIDDTEEQVHVWEHEWDQFLTHHYLLVHEKAKFSNDNNTSIRQLERKASKVLTTMSKFWPQIDIDGVLNIWIVKPGNKCRGRGIQLMNNIKDIIGLINIPVQKTRYVVQKYIENPLVIYDTKFDIRQWFLITNCQPLTIWVYKDSYLRFSSQIFSLSNYHESVHLTNNAVQTKYKNNEDRDKALPDENMWDCHTFKAYLKQIGKYELWDTKIYPGMKQCLVGAMLACQETMDKRQNSFELYGADFMLTEDFTPWLIEINSSPDLAPTTSVTARLCPQCLEDVIKVVLDRRLNPDADTGTFELAYRQTIPKAPAYLGLSLCINGKRLFKKSREKKHDTRSITPVAPREPAGDTIPDADLPVPPEYSGPIITDFLSWLNPYDALPCNKDGILLGPKDSLTVRQAVTVVKSGITFKNGTKKRKSSAISSRTHRGRKEKTEFKRRIVPHSCCLEDNTTINNNGKYRTESARRIEKPKTEKSVGNKRCYIDPSDWERETASILRSTISVQNKQANKTETALTFRQTKSRLNAKTRSSLDLYNIRNGDDSDPIKNLSAIGTNICKLRDDGKNVKSISFSKSCTSIYAPYRVVVTPLNDVPVNANFKRKNTSQR
ncbi:tubulin glycylase 3A-like isoform X1 [Bombyx mandarina]|uniref:Tubulin glycylase 3A-like isoform X1 n=1 Tax=Bombyx mandarina TaxID=7092 RepID=A0A6J2K1R0_BOMMA|nr:tubulin glycylase 3A-like isoform X1 [Bombyx mandarina]XP_028035825.1 tubulin glycylase 3A-like isoform X1 [Bombyx mandarina]